jgi:hypothetical protein
MTRTPAFAGALFLNGRSGLAGGADLLQHFAGGGRDRRAGPEDAGRTGRVQAS